MDSGVNAKSDLAGFRERLKGPVVFFLVSALTIFAGSCSGDGNNTAKEQERHDSIMRAKAAMDAAREAALIKARIEDSLNNLEQLDTASVSDPVEQAQ